MQSNLSLQKGKQASTLADFGRESRRRRRARGQPPTMLRSLWNRAVVHLMDEPVPTSDEVSDSSPTSPLGSPSAGPRTNLTAALQVP